MQIRGLSFSSGKLYIEFEPGEDSLELVAVDNNNGTSVSLILIKDLDIKPLIEALREAFEALK